MLGESSGWPRCTSRWVGMGPSLHANLWSKLPATGAPAIAFPQTQPHTFLQPFVQLAFPPLSPFFATIELLPMALRVVSSLFGREDNCFTFPPPGQDPPITVVLQIQWLLFISCTGTSSPRAVTPGGSESSLSVTSLPSKALTRLSPT